MAGGEPVELEAHMGRLESSTRELYGEAAPPAAHQLVLERARGVELGRLRLDVAPGGDGLSAAVKVADVDPALVFPSWERAVTLAALVVPGGIGAHKWSDRRLLERAERESAGALPLVLDADGTVLEASRGNIFLARGGVLVTPPPDGRLLPGVARRRIADVAAAAGVQLREEVVSGDELAGAGEAFVSGSVRGVEPVLAYGERRWREGELTRVISAGLREVWLKQRRPDYARSR